MSHRSCGKLDRYRNDSRDQLIAPRTQLLNEIKHELIGARESHPTATLDSKCPMREFRTRKGRNTRKAVFHQRLLWIIRLRRRKCKHYTAEEKVAILRRHLLDKVPVSDLCEEHGLQPTVFYRWQKEFFENGASAFRAKERPVRQVEEKQKRIEFLEKKVQTKDEVLAELMAEHVALKKSLGEL
jgi:transposase